MILFCGLVHLFFSRCILYVVFTEVTYWALGNCYSAGIFRFVSYLLWHGISKVSNIWSVAEARTTAFELSYLLLTQINLQYTVASDTSLKPLSGTAYGRRLWFPKTS